MIHRPIVPSSSSPRYRRRRAAGARSRCAWAKREVPIARDVKATGGDVCGAGEGRILTPGASWRRQFPFSLTLLEAVAPTSFASSAMMISFRSS